MVDVLGPLLWQMISDQTGLSKNNLFFLAIEIFIFILSDIKLNMLSEC